MCVVAFSTCDYAIKPEREEKFCKIHLEPAVFLHWLRKLIAEAVCVRFRGRFCAIIFSRTSNVFLTAKYACSMRNKKLLLNKIVVSAAACFALAMIVFPEVTEEGAKMAIILWLNAIVPVLLPFFIFSDFIKSSGDLAKLPPRIYPFIMGFLSGYPMGAKVTGDYVREGRLTLDEGRAILSYSMVTGPAFILFTVGQFIGSSRAAALVAAAHYAGALANGFFYRQGRIRTGRKAAAKPITSRKPTTPITPIKSDYMENFTAAILGGFKAMAIILAYLIVFYIGIDLASRAGLFAAIDNKTVCACLKGLLEMTIGTNQVGMCDIGIEYKTVLAAMLVSFGGLSVAGQSASMTRNSGLGFKDILLMKLTHGMLAAIFAILLTRFVVL